MQLIGKIDCGLVGEVNTVKLWMNLATKISARGQQTSDSA